MDKESNSALSIIIRSFKSLPSSKTQVSYVYNKVNNNFDTLQKLSIYKINSKSPRIEPWGIPHFILRNLEFVPSKATIALTIK